MMLLGVDDWWYPILIVECLFVGAHNDVNQDPWVTGGWSRWLRNRKMIRSSVFACSQHTTTPLSSTNCSGSHRRASYFELLPPSGGQRPARLALALVILTRGRQQQYRQKAEAVQSNQVIQQSYWPMTCDSLQPEGVYLRAFYFR